MLSRFIIGFFPKEQASFNFMAAITIQWFWIPRKVYHCFHCFCICLPWSDGTICHDCSFLNAEFLASFFTLLFHPHLEALLFLFTFCHKGGVMCVSELIDISLSVLIPACASSSLAFHIMYSAFKLNKQVTIYSLDVLLSQFGTSLLFHVQF